MLQNCLSLNHFPSITGLVPYAASNYSKPCQLYSLFREGFYIIRYIIQYMETSMHCQLCEKKTHELSYWFDKMVCNSCYNSSRTRSDVILEASAN